VNILILNGSPRPNGNTAAMAGAFAQGARTNGHTMTVIDVAGKQIAGCLGCEYCHTEGHGVCKQKDDMQDVYQALETADMLVLASPVYYFGFTGQLQCALHRTYAVGKPKRLKQTLLLLSSGSDDVYEGAVYEYQKTFQEYMGLKDMGVYTAHGSQNKSPELFKRLREAGERI
jgi:multimeric flavodoxin WrbA